MPRCLPSSPLADSRRHPHEPCEAHEMSPGLRRIQNWKPRLHIIVLLITLCWTINMVVGQTNMDHEYPPIYVECEDFDDPERLHRRSAPHRKLVSDIEFSYMEKRDLRSGSTAINNLIAKIYASETKNYGLQREIHRLRNKLAKSQKERRKLRKKLKKRRKTALWRKHRRREKLKMLATPNPVPTTKQSLPPRVVLPRDRNETLAWECRFQPRLYTTRGYPEVIKTGSCSSKTCAGLNDIYRCVEQKYYVPYLINTSVCMDLNLRTAGTKTTKRVKTYRFKWYEAVVDCKCEKKPET